MTKETERRRFERLEMGDAVALDETGRELGQVTQVGGGGVGIKLNPERRLDVWTVGQKLRVTVVEPGATSENTMMYCVRYFGDGVLGLEFAR